MLTEYLDVLYLKTKFDNIDLSITGLRDALRGTGNKTLTDLDTDLSNIYARLDVALSTRASETTLSGIKTQTDKLTFDGSNRLAIQNPPNLDTTLSSRLAESTFTGRWDGGIYGFDGTTARKIKTDSSGKLQIDVLTTANPPNFDVALSTRASETTLSGIKTQTDKLTFDGSNRLAIQNPPNLDTTLSSRLADSKIPNALGQASLDVVGSTMYALAMVPNFQPSRMPYCITGISVSTTESNSSIASPGGKLLILRNRGDQDIQIGLNASVPTTNPVILRARTVRVFMHKSVTSVYYKTSSGTSTLDIEYWN
ncbi:MAG: hypothetical protein QXI12_04155 [Candidatus Methanomethyliaceae archaeon]